MRVLPLRPYRHLENHSTLVASVCVCVQQYAYEREQFARLTSKLQEISKHHQVNKNCTSQIVNINLIILTMTLTVKAKY